MKDRSSMKRISAIIIFVFSVVLAAAGQSAYIPPDKPRLVVGIVVEQLKFEQLEKYRDRLSEGGIRKLMNEGTYFRNAAFEYMLTQSAPGHATIATGAEPSSHGITSDSWYVPLKNELINCTKDNSSDPVGGSFESGLHSPVNLQAVYCGIMKPLLSPGFATRNSGRFLCPEISLYTLLSDMLPSSATAIDR